jgi:hypothetical protein
VYLKAQPRIHEGRTEGINMEPNKEICGFFKTPLSMMDEQQRTKPT